MSLKKIVFKLMVEDKCTDQQIVNLYGDLPNLQTVENYKTQYKKQICKQ